MRSAKISYKGEEVDLCLCRTKATFSQEGSTRILTLDPVDIEFYDLTVKLQTKIYFEYIFLYFIITKPVIGEK